MKQCFGPCQLIRLLILMMMSSTILFSCASDQDRLNQKRAAAIRDLGEAYMGQKQYTRALREFLKAERIYSDDPFLQNNLGVAYMAKGSLDLSIKHFKKALKLKPDYSPARNNLGTAYMEKENWDAAIECFLTVNEDLIYGTPHYPLTNLGFVYYKLGDYEKSITYYKEALEIAPKFPKATHGLGLTYMADGRYKLAVKTLEKAVDRAPGEALIYIDLGRAYKLTREYNKAYDAFNMAASIAKDPEVKEEAEMEAKKVLNKQ